MVSANVDANARDPDTVAATWRLLEAGDTLCVAQVETIGMRMLLKRARTLAREQSSSAQALNSIEDLAQLLALWRPGAYAKDREQAYFDVRFARERPAYPHPSVGGVLDRTAGQLLYAEQVVELLSLLGFDWPRADAFRGALMRGRMGERIDHERYLRQLAKKQGWTAEQADGLVATSTG
jgi:DNA polymerase III subunit alpha